VTVGHPHRHFRSVGSTNDIARALAASGAPGGTVVTSEEQTSGRGRQGRPWATPAGSALAWSLLIRRAIKIPGILPLVVGLAVCEAVESLGVERAHVKWPNDIWIDGRKCAGILVEARPQDGWAVVGVGLNLAIAEHEFPEEIRGRATSVRNGATIVSATAALNREVGALLDADPKAALAQLKRRDALRGQRIAWDGGRLRGVASGIDEGGNLMVREGGPDGSSEFALNAGEVHLEVEEV
jgi:BirA family biotin operon repressor/biotin-[acetyl-CoA-carboxylase] ligase